MPTKKITLRDTEYTARALTVREVFELIDEDRRDREIQDEDVPTAKSKKKDEAKEQRDLELSCIRMLFEDPLDPRAFFLSLGVSFADISHLTPEEIQQLMEVVAEANPTFAGMEKRLRKIVSDFRTLSSGLPSA
jgi:hypothetical protein